MSNRPEGVNPDTVQLRSGRIFERGDEWLGTLADGERERIAREVVEEKLAGDFKLEWFLGHLTNATYIGLPEVRETITAYLFPPRSGETNGPR
jgi:hypothetical protein